MKKHLWLAVVACMLIVCMFSVFASASEPVVVYLNGSIETPGNGATAATAVKTWADAYAALNGGDGTIVVCGNIDIAATTSATSTSLSATSGNVVITSRDPETSEGYTAVVKVTSSSNNNRYLSFLTSTTLKDITINSTTNKSTYVISGPSLTVDTGVIFQYKGSVISKSTTSDQIVVRVGAPGSSASNLLDASFTQKSGTLSSVYSGLGSDGASGAANITLSGDAVVTLRVQGGASSGNVSSSDIDISGNADINELFIGGHTNGTNTLGSSDIDITGGTVAKLALARTSGFKVSGNIDVTIGGTANVQAYDFSTGVAEGTNTLNIDKSMTVASGFGAIWNNVNIGSGADVEVTGEYTSASAAHKVDGSLKLSDGDVAATLSAANTGTGTISSDNAPSGGEGGGAGGEGSEGGEGGTTPTPTPTLLDTVYVGGANASSTNDGSAADKAVSTLAEAYALLKSTGGTIVLCGDVSAVATTGFSAPFPAKDGKVTIQGNTGSEVLSITPSSSANTAKAISTEILSALEWKNLTFNWANPDDGALYIFTGPDFTIGEGVTILKNGAAFDSAKDRVAIRVSAFSNDSCTAPKFTQKSGVLSAVYCGSDKVDISSYNVSILGDSKILIMLQGGATNNTVGAGEITIGGNADITALYLGGYDSKSEVRKVESIDVTMTGGNIDKVIGARTENVEVGNVSFTVSGNSTIGAFAIGNHPSKTGTSYVLTIKDAIVLKGLDSYWTSIVMEDDAKVYLADAYTLGDNILSVADGAVMYLSAANNTAEPTNYVKSGSAQTGKVVLDAHNHTLTHVDAACSSTGADGNIEYWVCQDANCSGNGNRYLDEAGKKPVTVAGTKTTGGHDLTHNAEKVATDCFHPGNVEHWHCENCGKNYADSAATTEITTNVVVNTTHDLEHIDAEPATHTEDGILEHWHCKLCDWRWSDEDLAHRLYSEIDPKTGHGEDLKQVDAKDASCTEDGCIAHQYCEDCDKYYTLDVYGIEFPSKLELTKAEVFIECRHALKHAAAVAADTCLDEGNIEYWYCDTEGCANCGKFFSDAEGKTEITEADTAIIGAHDLKKVDEVPAEADKAGTKAHWFCKRCEKFFSDAEGKTEVKASDLVIPALGYEVEKETETGVSIEGLENAAHGESYTFTVKLEEGYVKGKDFKVMVNGKELKANADGSYTILSVTGKLEITVTGAVKADSIIPDTGDHALILPMILLLALSAAGLTVLGVDTKRRRV